MTAPPIHSVFDRLGAAQELGGDAPFLLCGDDVWLVRSGHVDVFAVRLEDGEPAGSRTHLFRVEPDRPLFAVGDAPADGRVVPAAYGCGAHSQATLVPTDRTEVVHTARYDTGTYDVLSD